MKKWLLIKCVVFLFVFSSCQKEIKQDLPPGGGGTTDDYQPVSAGSEWNYSSTSIGNFTVKSLGTDTLIGGVKYYKFDRVSTPGTQRAYYSKVNGVYKEYGYFAPIGAALEFTRLKDSAIGVNWTNIISLAGFSNYHKYTIAAKGIQHTVNGKTFNNVIELDYQFSLDNPLGSGIIQAGGGKSYFAKDVGAIESFYKTDIFGTANNDTTKLVSYTIR
ncbi:MAG: hypothetical protein M3O67_04635 [Bacteroidota bacterium]|nr:hypothetical protein [Bacteroidota bacterium]